MNRGGALKDDLVVEDEIDSNNPSEVQKKLIEQTKAREDALKKLAEGAP